MRAFFQKSTPSAAEKNFERPMPCCDVDMQSQSNYVYLLKLYAIDLAASPKG